MPAPDGNQWIRLYRGLAGVADDNIQTNRLGVHWTPDYETAKQWTDPEKYGHSAPGDFGDGTWRGIYDENSPGTIVSALIHKRHIIPENSPEWEDVTSQSAHGYSLGFEKEKELTIRPKSPVHITSIQKFNPDGTLAETTDYPITALRSRGRA